MGSRYGRATSPNRRFAQPGRASTGTLDAHDYESYYQHHPRSSRESFNPDPRSSADRIISSRPLAPRTYQESLPLRRNPDDHVVALRRAPTLEPNPVVSRRPLSIVTGVSSPSRLRPVVQSAIERPPSPYSKPRPRRDDESVYILPASSSRPHQHGSAGGQDMNRHLKIDKDKDRAEKGGYRSSGRSHGGQAYYYNPPPQIREPRDKDDRDYGYEYTNRKEQAYRDTTPRPRARRESDAGVRERPRSITGLEDYQRQPVYHRESGPPVSTRGFSKIHHDGTVRHEYRYPRDDDHGSGESSLVRGKNDGRVEEPRRVSTRAPVSLHQDDGYNSNIEDRNHDKHRRLARRTGSLERDDDRGLGIRYQESDQRKTDEKSRGHRGSFRSGSQERFHRASRHAREDSQDRYKHPESGRRRERDEHDDRDRRRADEQVKEKHGVSRAGENAALGAVGVATAAAGLAAESSKHRRNKDGSDFDAEKSPREKTHRDGRMATMLDPSEASSRSEETDEDRRERRRRRRRERDEKERQERGDALAATEANVRSDSYERSSKYPRDPQAEEEESKTSRRRRHRRTKSSQQSNSEESSDERPDREYRPSQLRVVSPPKEPEVKPKGILRPPREKFPEDPAPIREGVAPLKDAGKKGIPPNARWTKIDRRLVNPEALEQGNERYEERIDYVIVLRVLSKEDIEKYAELTQRLRGKSCNQRTQWNNTLTFHPQMPAPVNPKGKASKSKPRMIMTMMTLTTNLRAASTTGSPVTTKANIIQTVHRSLCSRPQDCIPTPARLPYLPPKNRIVQSLAPREATSGLRRRQWRLALYQITLHLHNRRPRRHKVGMHLRHMAGFLSTRRHLREVNTRRHHRRRVGRWEVGISFILKGISLRRHRARARGCRRCNRSCEW